MSRPFRAGLYTTRHTKGVFDGTGRLVEVQSVARDMTQRKGLELRLAELTRELDDFYEHAPCGYHSLAADGTILRINATELDWLGYRRDEVIGRMKITDFKPVNDTLGHAAGDQLLKEIGNRMQAVLRAQDSVGRLGGDEFVLLLGNLTDIAECRGVLQRLIDAIDQPVLLNEATPVCVTASIGVSLYPSDIDDADSLLRRADQAMYQAKNSGRNRVCIFAPE